MGKKLKSVTCALAVTFSLSLALTCARIGPFGVDVVSAATEATTTTPTTSSTSSTSTASTTYSTSTSVSGILKVGSRGNNVKILQTNLNKFGYKLNIDGIFGNLTLSAVKSFQSGHGLVVDGLAGPKTFAVLIPVTTSSRAILKIGYIGSDVKLLQTNLNKFGYKLDVDGIFGNLTLSAVKSFQSGHSLVVDGLAGPLTFAKLNTTTPAAPVTPTTTTSQQSTIKIGRAEYNAHGSGVVVAVVAMAGDKIVATSVDEYQFMDPTKIAEPLPNTAKLGANYLDATKMVLASKLRNTAYYSANMKASGKATQTWDANMAGIETFATGKTIDELDTVIKGNKNADGTDKDAKVDAVTSATFSSTNGYLSAIETAAKAAK